MKKEGRGRERRGEEKGEERGRGGEAAVSGAWWVGADQGV